MIRCGEKKVIHPTRIWQETEERRANHCNYNRDNEVRYDWSGVWRKNVTIPQRINGAKADDKDPLHMRLSDNLPSSPA